MHHGYLHIGNIYQRFMYHRYMHHRFKHHRRRGGKGGYWSTLRGSHGLSARRARRTKSRGPKGLHVEVSIDKSSTCTWFRAPPPSSTNVERLFSYGGLVATDHRSSLSGEKLDQILFLRENTLMVNFDLGWN